MNISYYLRKNFHLCLVKYFLLSSLSLLMIQDTSSAADMKCKISSSCSSCQQTDSKTVNPDSNITDNCSISTRKQALGMTWKQAKQEVQSTAVSPDLVLLHSNSTKDGHSASCECTAVYLRRALKINWSTSTPNKIFQDKTTNLGCHFSGWPLPHEVHWYKGEELITNETEDIYHSEDEKEENGEIILRSTLHLPPGREEQEGIYKCSASNSISSSPSCEIQMIYQSCIPLKFPNVNSSEIAANISSNVSLSCWIDWDTHCPDELLWKFNDTELKSGEKYKVELKDTNTKCQKEYILSIFNVTERDEGTYSCYWLCADENTATKASIDLNVIDDDLQSTVSGTEPSTISSQSNTVLVSSTHPGLPERDWLLPIIILSGGFVTLLIMLFVRFVVKKKWKSSHDMRKPCLLGEEDLINRLFISYSSKDFGWVTDYLISILEKHSIDYSIHSRDFEIGKPIVQNMADSVYGSRQVLIVLSENYLASNFCREELHMAVQRGLDGGDSSLIFVMIKNLKKKKLPPALRKKRLLDFDKHKKKQDWEEKILCEISQRNLTTSV